ncbi:MAG: dihydroxy-acid dehydratase [Desulfopila sp.]
MLYGNLAPQSAITKPAAIDPQMLVFSGPARVFDSEQDANQAILDKRIRPGDVIVIRYEGPKGGPGMPEMFKAMKLLNGMGMAKEVALVTDGRFSGTNNGCFVGHISPEAMEGGPIALIRDGDEIHIDISAKEISVKMSEKILGERRKAWQKPAPRVTRVTRGYLKIYSRLASSAAKGAVITVDDLDSLS